MEGIPHDIILEAWMKTKKFTREQLLTTGNNENRDISDIIGPIPISKNSFPIIGHTWADQVPQENLGKRDFMITYRKPPSLKDMLVRAKIVQPRNTTDKGCKRPNTCKYCKKISQSGKIKNLQNNKNLQYNDSGHLPDQQFDILPGM